MIISEVNVSYPCMKYKVQVSHFTARKSTAIEWIILEAISKVSNMNKYAGVAIETLFEQIFTISDADLLIKPCLLSLQDMGAIIAEGIDNESELKEIPMRNLHLTSTGKEMQKKGLLPGVTTEDGFTIYYDLMSESLLDAVGSNYRTEATGITSYNENIDNSFPYSLVKQWLERCKNKTKRFSWLMPTTTINDIEENDKSVLWRNVTKKVDLGHGLVWHIEGNDDVTLDELSLLNTDFGDGDTYNDIPLTSIVDPNSEIKKIVMMSNVKQVIVDNIKRDNLFCVRKEYYSDVMLAQKNRKDLQIGFILGCDQFSVDKGNKKLIFMVPYHDTKNENAYISINSNIRTGKFHIYAGSEERDVSLAYEPLIIKENLSNEIIKMVELYYIQDANIIFALHELGLHSMFSDYVMKLVSQKNGITEKAEIIDAINLQSVQFYNKKNISATEIEKILVDEAYILEKSKYIDDLMALIREFGNISLFKQNEQLFQKVLQSALSSRTYNNCSLEQIWNVWDEVAKVKKGHVQWISRNNLYKSLYTQEVLKDFIDRFSEDKLFTIEEHTVVEQIIVEMKRISRHIQEMLPEVDLEGKYSEEYILETIMKHKEQMPDIYEIVRKWKDEINRFETRVSDFTSIASPNSYFDRVNKSIEGIADALKVFFNDATIKYKNVYIVDTCTLINEPALISWFDDGKALLIIPRIVLNELDKLKSDSDEEKAFSAREAIRTINSYKSYEWLDISEESCPELLSHDLDSTRNDNRILSIAIKYCIKKPVLLSDDINFRNIADSINIDSMDLTAYKNMKEHENLSNQGGKNRNKKKKKKH